VTNLLAAAQADDAALVILIVGVRLVVPLFIPRFPLFSCGSA